MSVDESTVWNTSYGKGDNVLFYPHEEIIRFINRYVRKRYGFDSFKDICPLLSEASCASLDLGCGIGRHIKFLDEFDLNPYGIDLSETAIAMGKEWLTSIGKNDLAEKMIVASVAELPFTDDHFSICVSHGVLDSMPRSIAYEGMCEVRRVLKPGALMYLDLIMDNDHDGDEIVESGIEEGTTQSYFTIDAIKDLVRGFDILDFTIISRSDDEDNMISKRAHLVIRNNKE